MSKAKPCPLCGEEEVLDDCDLCEGSGFDTQVTDKPVCPHCGEEYAVEPADQINDGNTEELQCGKCEKPFQATATHIVYYCTSKE